MFNEKAKQNDHTVLTNLTNARKGRQQRNRSAVPESRAKQWHGLLQTLNEQG